MSETQNELDTIKQDLKAVKAMLRMLLPKGPVPIGEIARKTGRSRQAIREYLTKHYEPEKDFFKKDGKIFASEDTAIQLLQR